MPSFRVINTYKNQLQEVELLEIRNIDLVYYLNLDPDRKLIDPDQAEFE